MRSHLLLGSVGTFLLAGTLHAQDPAPPAAAHDHITITAAEVEWQAGPPSLPAGAQFAVIEGDPSADAIFTMRLQLPDGYVIPPHFHGNTERVTVLSGTFLLGEGETFDRAAAQRLPAGSFFALPAGMRHFAATEGETVVQITSQGPWTITYVNPADDPRR